MVLCCGCCRFVNHLSLVFMMPQHDADEPCLSTGDHRQQLLSSWQNMRLVLSAVLAIPVYAEPIVYIHCACCLCIVFICIALVYMHSGYFCTSLSICLPVFIFTTDLSAIFQTSYTKIWLWLAYHSSVMIIYLPVWGGKILLISWGSAFPCTVFVRWSKFYLKLKK